MRAITHNSYGSPDVLELRDVDLPTAGENQVLVRVRAASVNPYDWHDMRGTPYLMRLPSAVRRPKKSQMGVDVAGVVEAVGPNVQEFRPGDEVFGACGAAFAEYALCATGSIAPKPTNVTFEQAGSVAIAGLTALQGLRDQGRMQPGQRVLINGASGGVGTFAVQIAKALGAEVTGVCSTRNVGLVRSIGADHVIDYTREDFTRAAERYDLLLDIIGNHSLARCRRVLVAKGRYVMVGAPAGRWVKPMGRVLRLLLTARFVSQTMVFFISQGRKEDLLMLAELMAAGKLVPVIDRAYPLSDVPEAIRYLEEGHARGKVVITV